MTVKIGPQRIQRCQPVQIVCGRVLRGPVLPRHQRTDQPDRTDDALTSTHLLFCPLRSTIRS